MLFITFQEYGYEIIPKLAADGTGIGRHILSILFVFNGFPISVKEIGKCLCCVGL
jgi:hypothetical protein